MATMSFVMDEELKKDFAEIARFENRSIGFLLNEAGREFIKKKKQEILEDLELYQMSLEAEKDGRKNFSEEDFRKKFLKK